MASTAPQKHCCLVWYRAVPFFSFEENALLVHFLFTELTLFSSGPESPVFTEVKLCTFSTSEPKI